MSKYKISISVKTKDIREVKINIEINLHKKYL